MLPAGRVAASTRSLVTCICSRAASTSAQSTSSEPPVNNSTFPEPPDPLSCCGSGCQNCVWIQFADDVNAYFSKPNPDLSGAEKILNKFKAVKKEMEKHVEDPNLRAYLLMEIKAKLAQK